MLCVQSYKQTALDFPCVNDRMLPGYWGGAWCSIVDTGIFLLAGPIHPKLVKL